MSDRAGIKVVLVHGFLDTGWVFRRMKLRLECQGAVCLVPRLRPNDGRGGLEALASNLKRDVDAAFGPSAKIRIVAFSMGGLVSRHYLQVLGGAGRVLRAGRADQVAAFQGAGEFMVAAGRKAELGARPRGQAPRASAYQAGGLAKAAAVWLPSPD